MSSQASSAAQAKASGAASHLRLPGPAKEDVRNPSQSPRTAGPHANGPVPASASGSSSSSSGSASGPALVGPSNAAISAAFHKQRVPVFLNVYDLHPYNNFLHSIGFGAYHSAVELFGREYSFGFHDGPQTGVFHMQPRAVPNAVFREQVEVGCIYLTFNQFNIILNQLKAEWTGNKYHLLKRNCNHFSKALLAALGLRAPSFINRLASAGDTLAGIVPSFMLPKHVNALLKDGRPDFSEPEEPQARRASSSSSSSSGMLAAIPPGRSQGAGVPTLSNGLSNSGSGEWRQIAPPAAPPPGFSVDDGMSDEEFARFLRESEQQHEKEQQLRRLREETMRATEQAKQDVRRKKQRQASLSHMPPAASASPPKSPRSASRPPSASTPNSAPSLSPAPDAATIASSSSLLPCSLVDACKKDSESPLALCAISPQRVRLGPGEYQGLALPPSPRALPSEDEDARVERAMRDFDLGPNVSEEERAQIRAVLRMSMRAGAQ